MQSIDLRAVRVACDWANEQRKVVFAEGVYLRPNQLRDAQLIGLANPELVRVLEVPTLPLPRSQQLSAILERAAIFTESTPAFAFGHGIMLRLEHTDDRRILVHELARVAQYERLNGIEGYFPQWLWEMENLGESRSPMALATRLIEERLCGRRAYETRWSTPTPANLTTTTSSTF